MTQPGSADFRTVWTKSGSRIAPEVASLARIAEGGGISTKGMPPPTQAISHSANTTRPNSSGDRMSRRRVRASVRHRRRKPVVQPPGRRPGRERRCPEHGRHRAGPGMRPADQRREGDRQRPPPRLRGGRSWPRSHGPGGQALRQRHRLHQASRQDRGREQRGPDLDGLAVIGAGEQARPEPERAAGRQFADDGADQADRDRDLQRGEQIGQRRRQPQLAAASARGRPNRCGSGRAASARARSGP